MVITESMMTSILETSVDGLLAYGQSEASEERSIHKTTGSQLGLEAPMLSDS
jgi:hypothetical protein